MLKKLIFTFAFFLISSAAFAQEPVYNIENVTGDLYRFQSNAHYGVFLVTPEGIILADPINTATATWLKGELKARFNVPVKYVIYSHDHADHTSGGEVFADTAEFVSHVYAKAKIEESGHTPVPTIRFPQNYRITLGGKVVDLVFYGASHSDNLITISFPEERAIFLVDVVAVKRLPFRNLPDYYFPSAIGYLQKIEERDFDILIPGHGAMGTKQDVTDHKVYLIELYNEVVRGYLAGLSLEEIKAKANLEHYFHWGRYNEWLELNIEGMYRIIGELKEENPPELISYIHPSTPRNAAQTKTVGWVLLKFDVNAEGEAENIRVVDSYAESLLPGITNHSRTVRQFEKASIKALSKTTYAAGQPFEGLVRWDNFALPPNEGGLGPFAFQDGSNSAAFGRDLSFRNFVNNGVGGRTAGGIEQ